MLYSVIFRDDESEKYLSTLLVLLPTSDSGMTDKRVRGELAHISIMASGFSVVRVYSFFL